MSPRPGLISRGRYKSAAIKSGLSCDHLHRMECTVCEQQKTKLYCNKCIKEGIRQQSYQHCAVSRKRDEALEKLKTHLAGDARPVWTLRAERDEKKLLISLIRPEIERIQGLMRKGTHPRKVFSRPWADVCRETEAGECEGGSRDKEE